MYNELCRLEGVLRAKDKEIERLSYLNIFLTDSQKRRDELILENQKEIQRLKQLMILYQKKVNESTKKDIKEMGIVQTQHLTTSSDSMEQLSKDRLLTAPSSRKQKLVLKRATDTNQKKAVQESKIPLNRQVKPIDIRVADSVQFLVDNVNQEDGKNKNFFTLDEKVVLESLKENESLKFLNKLTKEENTFKEFIEGINYRGTYQLYESVKMISKDYESNISALIKLKRMLTGVSKIAGASDTLTAIEHVAHTVCDILVCDRCSAFVYDRQNNELWSPSGVASKVYRISDKNGIAGYVARTAESLNIKDVYNDPRFDNKYDIKTGYRTKTMLAVPIKTKDGEVLGKIRQLIVRSARSHQQVQRQQGFRFLLQYRRRGNIVSASIDPNEHIAQLAAPR